MNLKILNEQFIHWEKSFSEKPDMFGLEPSYSAKKSLEIFKKNNTKKIIELGAGLGRDTIFFAKNGIEVTAIDYSSSGIKIIQEKIKKEKIKCKIKTKIHDVKKKFNFKDSQFDGCYSHMLYCMALTTKELINLNKEVFRMIKPGGYNIFTVRNTLDGDYKNGNHIIEDIYENDGFLVHFFSDEKVQYISKSYYLENIEKFEEGKFPRKLSMVTLKR